MRLLKSLVVFAVAALSVGGAFAGEDKMLFDGTNYIALRQTFTNRVESFTNLDGRAFVGVRVEAVSPEGLSWWATNGFNGGRVKLADLSPETRAALKIPEALVDFGRQQAAHESERKFKETFDLADDRRRALAEADEKRKADEVDLLIGELEKAGVFAGWVRNGTVLRLKVGAPFFLLDFDRKKTAVGAVLLQAKREANEVKLVRLMDRRTNKQVGTFSEFGLDLD